MVDLKEHAKVTGESSFGEYRAFRHVRLLDRRIGLLEPKKRMNWLFGQMIGAEEEKIKDRGSVGSTASAWEAEYPRNDDTLRSTVHLGWQQNKVE